MHARANFFLIFLEKRAYIFFVIIMLPPSQPKGAKPACLVLTHHHLTLRTYIGWHKLAKDVIILKAL